MQLATGHRAAQLMLHSGPSAKLLVVLAVVFLEPVLAPLFGVSQREVGVTQQARHVGRGHRARHPDAHRQPHFGGHVRGAQHLEQPAGDWPRLLWADAAQQDGELVAAEPARHSVHRQVLPQAAPHLDEHRVPDVMSPQVVDALKAVEVECDEDERAARFGFPLQLPHSARRLAKPVSGSVNASSRKCASRSASRWV